MHLKIFIQIFGDPHTWFAGGGVLMATVPIVDGATEIVKLLAAIAGLAVVVLSGYHKYLQIKKEKNGKN